MSQKPTITQRVILPIAPFGLMTILIVLFVMASRAIAAPPLEKLSRSTRRVIILLDAPSVMDVYHQLRPSVLPEGSRSLSSEEQALLLAQVKHLKATQEHTIARLQAQHLISTVHRQYLHLLNGFAATIPAKKLKALAAAPGIRAVYPDHQVHATLDESVPLIGAPTLWAMTDPQGRPVRGQGIRVAVIDTGIDYTHPDLGGCFGSGCKVAGGYDFVNDDPDPWDDNGHGTHVAGIIAANGSVTGVAPEATLYAYKVLDADGSGWNSDIIAALERAVDPDGNPATNDGVHVINLSLGGPGSPDDPLGQAVDAIVDAGVVVAVAAGNSGDGYFTVESPGNARKALTVGASTKTDEVAVFSSRGPVYWGWLLKPDLLAPGVAIRSTVPDGGYEAWNGTSMATPHVAGGAALLRQLHPEWPPERVKAVLMNTAQDLSVSVLLQGAGRVFLPRAASPWVIVEPPSLSLGMVDEGSPLWERAMSFTVTNPTAQSVTYTLHLPTTFLPGVTASLSASQLAVEPEGAAQVTLTLRVDNSLFTPPGPPTYTVESKVLVMKGDRSLLVPVIFGVSPAGDAYEPDNTADQATLISTDGASQTHNFHVPGDEDWVRFEATVGISYTIETGNLGPGSDTVLYLYDTDGATELARNDDFGDTLASRILWQAPANGTYFIRVHHYNPSAMGPDTVYDVWVNETSPPQPDAYEPDDTPEQATSISTDGTPQTHNFHIPGDEDWLRFAATAGTWYVIETGNLGTNGDTVLHLYDMDGATELARNDDYGNSRASHILWQALADGTYFIRVHHYNPSAMGPDTVYDVWVNETSPPQPDAYEPDDTPEQATSISTDGTPQTHNFHVPGDEDWVRFEATVGISYTIETGNLGPGSDTVLHLYDTDGSTELVMNDDGGEGLASQIVWTAPESGLYYLRVHHYDGESYGADTQYDIWVQSTGGCELPHDFDNDGTISTNDVAMVVTHWRERSGDPAWDDRFDDDGDGRITVKDILAVSMQVGVGCAGPWYELHVEIEPFYARGSGEVYQHPSPNNDGKYIAGTRVHLHAWPDRDYQCHDTPYWRFVRWDGAITGSNSRGIVVMNDNQWVIAYFREMFPPRCTPTP